MVVVGARRSAGVLLTFVWSTRALKHSDRFIFTVTDGSTITSPSVAARRAGETFSGAKVPV